MTRLLTLCLLMLALAGGTAAAATTIAGGTIVNQTWTAAGSPYVIQGDITVPAGSTLTIGAGVEVQAVGNSDAQGAGNNTTRVEILIEGTLAVNGTAGSPVVMRSSVATAARGTG